MATPVLPTRTARRLEAALIQQTTERVRTRINERFPGSGLGRVAGELCTLAADAAQVAERLARPYYPLRVAMGVVVVALVVVLLPVLQLVDLEKARPDSLAVVVQTTDSTLQIIGVTGAVLFFLVTLEDRFKRRRALKALRELRSVVHVIDMHQLTKDPSVVDHESERTPSSPPRLLTDFQLARYLDYCSELLSLAAKIAALYAQSLPDPVVTDAVSDLERLTANLSQKIWQKIALLPGPGEPRRPLQ